MKGRYARALMGAVLVTALAGSLPAWSGDNMGWSTGGGHSNDDGDGPPAVQIGKEKLFPVNTNWVVESLNGKQMWSGEDRPAIYLDKELRLRGFDGCNIFTLTAYPLKGQKIAVGPLAVGSKVCDKTVQDAERSFLNVVRGAKTWDMEGANILIVKGLGGEARFDRGL